MLATRIATLLAHCERAAHAMLSTGTGRLARDGLGGNVARQRLGQVGRGPVVVLRPCSRPFSRPCSRPSFPSLRARFRLSHLEEIVELAALEQARIAVDVAHPTNLLDKLFWAKRAHVHGLRTRQRQQRRSFARSLRPWCAPAVASLSFWTSSPTWKGSSILCVVGVWNAANTSANIVHACRPRCV